MTRLWPEGVPVDATAEAGQLLAFDWQGLRTVRRIVDRWVIHDEWWREPHEGGADASGEIWRHYVQVETTDGLLCVLYQDLRTGAWLLERVYD